MKHGVTLPSARRAASAVMNDSWATKWIDSNVNAPASTSTRGFRKSRKNSPTEPSASSLAGAGVAVNTRTSTCAAASPASAWQAAAKLQRSISHSASPEPTTLRARLMNAK